MQLILNAWFVVTMVSLVVIAGEIWVAENNPVQE